MTIKGLTKLENRKNTFIAELDDGAKLRLTTEQIVLFGIHAGQEFSYEEFNSLREEIELNTTKARAIRALGSSNLSAGEMKRRLIRKGASSETSQKAVEWLEDIGLINDPEYAVMIAKHYSGKGYGIARIKDEFYKRGISRDLWDETLDAVSLNGSEAALIFLQKKLRGSIESDELNRARDALCRRGFSYEEAKTAIREYTENAENAGNSESSDDAD